MLIKHYNWEYFSVQRTFLLLSLLRRRTWQCRKLHSKVGKNLPCTSWHFACFFPLKKRGAAFWVYRLLHPRAREEEKRVPWEFSNCPFIVYIMASPLSIYWNWIFRDFGGLWEELLTEHDLQSWIPLITERHLRWKLVIVHFSMREFANFRFFWIFPNFSFFVLIAKVIFLSALVYRRNWSKSASFPNTLKNLLVDNAVQCK